MALPSNVGYGTVTARFLLAYADGSDVDAYPDGVAAAGSVTFTPSAAYIKNVTASPSPVTIIPSAITCSLDSEGYLLGTDGNRGVKLVATDDQDNNPVGWTWTVSFALLDANGANAGNLSSFSFSLATDATVDLTSVSPVPSANGTFYITAPATTLSIGTVTTGAPGSSAAVSISGTAPSQTLNFTIPQGPTGATGAAGADGSLTGLTVTSPLTYATATTTLGLADVSPSPAGTYGSSSQIPQITVDAKGRVTAVTTNSASGGGGSSYGAASNYKVYQAGRYYTATGLTQGTQQAQALNTMTFVPFYVTTTTTFTKLAAYVNTGVASSTIRLGIYSCDANDVPTTLVYGSGSIATTASNTQITQTINQTLSAGLYFLAAVGQIVKPNMLNFTSTYAYQFPNVPVQYPGTYANNYIATSISGALPSTLTPGLSGVYLDTLGINPIVVWLGL